MIYIYIYILLYLWGPGGPSIVKLVPSSFPEILSPISIYVKSHLNVHQTFVSLNSGTRGGGGGICHAYVDSSDIKVSAKEDLIRVETYVQEGGQLTIRFGPQCENRPQGSASSHPY